MPISSASLSTARPDLGPTPTTCLRLTARGGRAIGAGWSAWRKRQDRRLVASTADADDVVANSSVRIVSATGYSTEALRTCPTEIRSRRQSLTLAVPAEHTHGPEGVPPARSPLALVYREVQLTGMGILEGPAAVRTALGLDQVDRLGHPLVRNGAGRAQVVETSEHVVIPIGRVRELRPGGRALSLSVLNDHLTGREPAKHPPLKEVLLAAQAGSGHVREAPHRSLVLQQTLQHLDRGVK